MATVIRTLGSASDATRSISAVTGANPYDLTFDSALNYTPAIGDTVTDFVSDLFVVSGVTSTTAVEVTDEFGVGNAPDTGLATVSRAYSSISSAHTGIPLDASSGDTLEWRGYNDSVFAHGILEITDTTLGASGTLRFTVPTSERHDGTAGTGFRIQFTPGGGGNILGFNSTHIVDLDGIELIGVDSHGSTVNLLQWVAGASGKFQNCIVHDFTNGAGGARGIGIGAGNLDIINCIVYDITTTGVNGLGIQANGTFSGVRILNCTVNKCDGGVLNAGGTAPLVQNTASFAGAASFSSAGWDPASDFNATDQTTGIPGGNSLDSLDAADQFVNTADGSEDYSLLLLSDLIDAGTNLSGIFTNDIAGATRPIGPSFDIGAFEAQTAPICWQATAIVAGRPWQASGAGQCPTVIRVPKGAQGVIVTDNGQEIHPRIIEG